MNAPLKATVVLCTLVAIYAGCCKAWWIMDSWIVSAVAILGWGSDKDLIKYNDK